MARILLVAASYPPRIGGYERQVQATRRLLRALGHAVEVAACVPADASPPATEASLPVPARFLVGGSFPVSSRRALRRIVRDGGWDLVVTNTRFFLPTWQAARAARAHAIPYVHVEHGSGPMRGHHAVVDAAAGAFDRTAGRWVVRHAAAAVGVSRAAAAFLRRLGADDPVVIGNAVAFDAPAAVERRLERWFSPQAAARSASTQGSRQPATIVSVGRLVPNKGLMDLVVAAGGLAPTPRLRFVGEGAQRPALVDRAATLRVPLELAGAVGAERVREELLAADLACQPSLEEGFGLALLEAVACGTPVVASDCAAHRELLDGGRYGLLHKAGDAADLRRVLEAALDDPVGCAQRALAAHGALARRHGEAQARDAWQDLLGRLGIGRGTSPDKPK